MLAVFIRHSNEFVDLTTTENGCDLICKMYPVDYYRYVRVKVVISVPPIPILFLCYSECKDTGYELWITPDRDTVYAIDMSK